MRLAPAASAAALALVGWWLGAVAPAASEPPAWVAIDYAEIVDRRQPTHSGEPVGVLLDRLDGRPAPDPGERSRDALDHTLLEPWLEPYAFVLPDVLESLTGAPARPFAEPAWRWSEGEAQPAWVELLRARRYVVESDGAGEVRVFAPRTDAAERDPEAAARAAWERAWPVLRHPIAVLLAERGDRARPLSVRVYAYAHRPERTSFLLGLRPHVVAIGDDAPAVARPPLDLDAWASFLASGLTLEGARLEPDGAIRLLGARRERAATLLGSPPALADLAVAYRAVFHGGRAEPYMSLDRGPWPETAVVNYGGRLRDTRLGEIALRCDIRFKTFSLGIDVVEGEDVRERVRAALPEFATHLERFAADPAAGGVLSQQTRLWFYPDAVDLTLSEQGDVLVLRRVRMSAASERVATGAGDAAAAPEPPWTRATVDAVNRDYDALAALFPELADLDQAVRLLALFSWLRQAEADGLPVPDLDALLAVELPAWPTPRTFPQLLAFNALPAAGARGAVETVARPDVHAALDRLRPRTGAPLPARRRLDRAVARLDGSIPEHRALLDEIAARGAAAADETLLDVLAYRAERLAMHRLVLGTIPEEVGRPLAERVRAGEALRVFSVAIGGIDLGMRRAIDRAPRRSLALGASAAARPTSTPAVPRRDAAPATTAPRSTAPVLAAAPAPSGRIDLDDRTGSDGARTMTVAADVAGPGARVRVASFPPDGTPVRVDRHESGRDVRAVLERFGDRVRVRRVKGPAPAAPVAAPAPGPRTAWLALDAGAATAAERALAIADPDAERPARTLRWIGPDGAGFVADYPRSELDRLLLGPAMERGEEGIRGLQPLPDRLGAIDRVLVAASPVERLPPWIPAGRSPAPEETAASFADGLRRWSQARGGGPAVAVAVRADAAGRWDEAPPLSRRTAWILPDDAFPGTGGALAARLRETCGRDVVPALADARGRPSTVVLASAESADRLAERAMRLAADPAMAGRRLAVIAIGAPVRADLAARLLAAGDLAGVGLWTVPVPEVHALPAQVRAWREGIAAAGRRGRTDDVPFGPLWYF